MAQKYCPKCKKDRPLTDFGFDARTRDNKKSSCRRHAREDVKKWREENADRVKEYNEARAEQTREHAKKSYRRSKIYKEELARLQSMSPEILKIEDLREIFKHWQNKCALCEEPATGFDLILRRTEGGTARKHNLMPTCQKCVGRADDLFTHAAHTSCSPLKILKWSAKDQALLLSLGKLREKKTPDLFQQEMVWAISSAI